jgi:hypothetical protein
MAKELTPREAIELKVMNEVAKYFHENNISTRVPFNIILDKEAVSHIINIGTSIMMNRIGVNTYPGSFVKAVLDNDLHGAFSRADSINSQVLGFYITMMHNLSIPVTVDEVKEAMKV